MKAGGRGLALASGGARRRHHAHSVVEREATTMLENRRRQKRALDNFWQQKNDEDITFAATQLFDYTEEAKQVIRFEMRKRGIPAPPLATRTEVQSHKERSDEIFRNNCALPDEHARQL